MDFIHLDANEGIFFNRELEHVKAELFEVKDVPPKYAQLIPVDTSAGGAAEYITYTMIDGVGQWKFIADYADDLPTVDVFGKQYTAKVKSIGSSVKYSIQEIRAGAKLNRPLDRLRLQRADKSYQQTLNKYCWLADGSNSFGGVTGILYNPNITKVGAPTGDWATATTEQIYDDVAFAINNPSNLTNGVEEVDTCLLPVEKYNLLNSKRISTFDNMTILQALKGNFPGVTFDYLAELKNVNPAPSDGGAATNCILTYKRNPMNLQFQVPLPKEVLPAQQENLAYKIPLHARVSDVIIYYPLSVQVTEDI
jgi:hypothetical protein